MEEKGVRIGFASFDLADDLHISIARRWNATEEELIAMQQYVDTVIKPHLPFTVTFGSFCRLGENGTFPAYKVYISDPLNLIGEMYTRFYKEAPNKALFPKPKFHITVDTPEKRKRVEDVIRAQPFIKATTVSFKTRVEGGTPEVIGNAWRCQICGNFNPNDQRNCLSANCDQWRPSAPKAIDVFQAPPKRHRPDWTCIRCQIMVFGSKDRCFKCGATNPN